MPVQWSVVRVHKENKSCKEISIHWLWTLVSGPFLQRGPNSLKHWAALAPQGLEFLPTHANINQESLCWREVNYAGVTSVWQTGLMDSSRDGNMCPFIFHMVIFHFQPLGFAQLQKHIQLQRNRTGRLIFRRNHTLRSMHTAGIQLEPNVLEAM